jgi:hypothetical protein
MFLNLHEVEDPKKRDFILEVMLKEFGDVATEARKVFDRFKMLGSCVDVISTLENVDKTKPHKEIEIPIPFKLMAMHEVLEKNFDWIVPENLFDESSEPKRVEKRTFETHIDKIQCLAEKFSILDLNT